MGNHLFSSTIALPPAAENWQRFLCQAGTLHSLLHNCRAKSWAGDSRGYDVRLCDTSVEQIAKHLAGQLILAFAAVRRTDGGPCGNFIAFDIDAQFWPRLPAFSDVLEELGLLGHAFASACKGRNRGKVVIVLGDDVHSRRATLLGKDILERVTCNSRFGKQSDPKEVEVFPKGGEGGQCRIGGRSHRADAQLEELVDLNGARIDLSTIRRLAADAVRVLTDALVTPISLPHRDEDGHFLKSVQREQLPPRIRNMPLVWSYSRMGGTNNIRHKALDVAREHLRVYGPDRGKALFMQMMGQIRDSSPELFGPSPTTRDKRNPLALTTLEKLWAYVLDECHGWQPVNVTKLPIRTIAKRAYEAIVRAEGERGLMRHCFGLSSRDLAVFIGHSKTTALNWIHAAAEAGLVVILHEGCAGENGLPQILGLVCKDETADDVRRIALSDGMVIARYTHLENLASDHTAAWGWASVPSVKLSECVALRQRTMPPNRSEVCE